MGKIAIITGGGRGIGAATAHVHPARRQRRRHRQRVIGRGGQPEEVANAIVWLLSDEASFSTGTFIDVTGGR